MARLIKFLVGTAAVHIAVAAPMAAQASDNVGSPDAWAARVEQQMTQAEKLSLVHGIMPLPLRESLEEARKKWPADVIPGAGYVPGVPRLGISPLKETDASLGVTNPFGLRPGEGHTALPASIALGATFNPSLAYRGGQIAGSEARAAGFNVLLGGGINLMRDPRNGRNFEYISEDPLLTGLLGAEAVRGAQAAGVISTVKHFAVNSYETNRHHSNSIISAAAQRESDLLAFEIAIEKGDPGSVMCGYNLVNGEQACGNDWLLNAVLKDRWGYKGWVMSDWGAVRGWEFAAKGLDQQSGAQLDKGVWFDAPLKAALDEGKIPQTRLSDMVRRILRAMRVRGLDQNRPAPAVNMADHAATALTTAREGIVLLKNDGALPLAASAKSVAVIGGNAHIGVLSGGGSSQVMPVGGWPASVALGGEGATAILRVMRYFGPSPLSALKSALPSAAVRYDPGMHARDAAALAAKSDVAIVFVTKYEVEAYDSPDLTLPYGQDALVSAVAKANPNTIVVLETGNPVAMPWKDEVKGIVAAWYPGQEGATAIAEVLTGAVNPSGRLPITFPADVTQLPRPDLPGHGTDPETPVDVTMNEGADVGYRWFAKKGFKPLYAFGHGLSYTAFDYSDFKVKGGQTITAQLTVRNTGKRAGADVPQLYLSSINGEAQPRLLAFEKVSLAPGESRRITMSVDPRLIAGFDEAKGRWRISGGKYVVALSRAADAPDETAEVGLAGREFGK